MAGSVLKQSLYWDETECLSFYGMLSLHEVFEVVGSQLTDTDVDVLSFLVSETCASVHPLDPASWTVQPNEEDPPDAGEAPSPKLLVAWRRLQSRGSPQPTVAWCKPRNGLELLLELERRGYISEGNLDPLLKLLRVLTRHDLLPLVSHKKRRTVSPERTGKKYGVEHSQLSYTSGLRTSYTQAEMPLPSLTYRVRTGSDPIVRGPSMRKRRRKRGNGWSRKPKKAKRLPLALPQKASCTKVVKQPVSTSQFWNSDTGGRSLSGARAQYNVRLRVRAEYLEHESALRNGVSSDKRQPLERQFELFSQADSLLHARDLGAIMCDIKFTELANLEAFWVDYLSGALLEALKGVFITESLRVAAGSEGVRLLISVDQDDYEEGRRVLRAGSMLLSSTGGHKNNH
ncbi:death effector domain-containing 1 isoform X1 [Phyllopteryx taeniolatus]|uniref:death effector domain-containing 1 isoform X1 n=1 Tax=Phyllopteryx taeniolatus TaxID=161469 RepID=UPI002AD3D011|nr:death effector domain-containing 1 isoform X1 [Phyllopteryx taeniolatus]XP_061631642.1 death effector domain-containing 1 isoform X1 [Phyllopteryx taeniolatus]